MLRHAVLLVCLGLFAALASADLASRIQGEWVGTCTLGYGFLPNSTTGTEFSRPFSVSSYYSCYLIILTHCACALNFSETNMSSRSGYCLTTPIVQTYHIVFSGNTVSWACPPGAVTIGGTRFSIGTEGEVCTNVVYDGNNVNEIDSSCFAGCFNVEIDGDTYHEWGAVRCAVWLTYT